MASRHEGMAHPMTTHPLHLARELVAHEAKRRAFLNGSRQFAPDTDAAILRKARSESFEIAAAYVELAEAARDIHDAVERENRLVKRPGPLPKSLNVQRGLANIRALLPESVLNREAISDATSKAPPTDGNR